MDAHKIYSDLLAEIRREETATAKKKEFAAFLLSRLPATERGEPVDDSSVDPVVMAQELGQPTRKALVEKIVRGMENTHFTATTVLDRMAADGVEPLPPKVRITTILGRMADAREIVMTQKGGGNQPNWYRLANAVIPAGIPADELFTSGPQGGSTPD